MSHNLCRPPWKQCALLLILLSHAVFGSPIVPTIASNYKSLEPSSKAGISGPKSVQTSLEEDIFGPNLDKRSNRKKRLFYETLKKAKQAKFLALMTATSDTLKSVAQSVFKNVVTLGIKFVIFNFLYAKVNQVLDFKTRQLNNLERQNREQNSDVLGSNDINTAASNTRTTTVVPPELEVSTFNPDKISLNLPGTLFATGFSVINAAASVLENLVQHSAVRVSKVFEALKPLIQSFSKNRLPSKKRETDSKVSKSSSTNAEKIPRTPIKNSYVALTQR